MQAKIRKFKIPETKSLSNVHASSKSSKVRKELTMSNLDVKVDDQIIQRLLQRRKPKTPLNLNSRAGTQLQIMNMSEDDNINLSSHKALESSRFNPISPDSSDLDKHQEPTIMNRKECEAA